MIVEAQRVIPTQQQVTTHHNKLKLKKKREGKSKHNRRPPQIPLKCYLIKQTVFPIEFQSRNILATKKQLETSMIFILKRHKTNDKHDDFVTRSHFSYPHHHHHPARTKPQDTKWLKGL